MSNVGETQTAVNRPSTRPNDISLPEGKRTTLTPEDFELIPRGWIEPYVVDACNAVPSPPLWNVAGALALAAHSLSRWGWSIANGHHTRPALAWAIVSESGSGKGLAISYLRQFLYNFYREAPEVLKDDCLFDEESNTYKNTLLEFTGTPEGLFWEAEERLYEAPSGKRSCLLGAHDEMHEIFSRARTSPIYITDMIAIMDQRDEVRRTQVNIKQLKQAKEGRTGIIPQPTLSALFAVAEPRLREVLTPEHLTGGFCSRLMWLTQPGSWTDPRDVDTEWLRPLAENDRNRGVYARELFIRWLLTLETPGRLIFTEPTIEAHITTVQKWRAEFATSVLRELVARMDSHLLALAATIAGVEGAIVRRDNDRTAVIYIEPEHYELATKLYQRVLTGTLWLHRTGQPKGALAVLSTLEAQPLGCTARDLSSALHMDYRALRQLLDMLLKDEEVLLVHVRPEGGGIGRSSRVYLHPCFRSRLAAHATIQKGVWMLTGEARTKLLSPVVSR